MNPRSWFRQLCVVASIGLALLVPAVATARQDVGFVASLRGRPMILGDEGISRPLKLLQKVSPGAVLMLSSGDAVGICHEAAATSYRIEGAGTILVDSKGLSRRAGAGSLIAVGACGATPTSSETGGVLLRSVKVPD